MAAAAKLKAEADTLFRAKRFIDAIEKYTAAINDSKSDDDDHDAVKATSRCYSNRAACREKLVANSYGKKKTTLLLRGLDDGRTCVKLDPSFVRGYQRLTTFLLLSLEEKNYDDWSPDIDSDDDDDDDGDNVSDEKKKNTMSENKNKPNPAAATLKLRRELETASRQGLALDPANEALLEALQVLRDLPSKEAFALNVQLEPTDVELSLADGAGPRSKAHKTTGATAFQQKKWAAAEKAYTKALACDPASAPVVPMGLGHATAILYSNRSATRSAQENYATALRDADTCLALRPEWSKGHSRRATALFGLGQYGDAEDACNSGLLLDMNNIPLQEMLVTCQSETSEPLAVQQEMFRLRQQAQQDVKMNELMAQFSGGGAGGPKVFNTSNLNFNSAGGNPFANLGSGGLGGSGLEGLFGGQQKKPKLTDQQMRAKARANVTNGTIPSSPFGSDGVAAASKEDEVLTDDDDDDNDEVGAVKSIVE